MGQPTSSCRHCTRNIARHKLCFCYISFDKIYLAYNRSECCNTLTFSLNLALTNTLTLSKFNLPSLAGKAVGIKELDWTMLMEHKYRSDRQILNHYSLVQCNQNWPFLMRPSIFPSALLHHPISECCRTAQPLLMIACWHPSLLSHQSLQLPPSHFHPFLLTCLMLITRNNLPSKKTCPSNSTLLCFSVTRPGK